MLIPISALLSAAVIIVAALIAIALLWFFSVRAYFMPYRSGTHYLEVIVVTETFNTGSFSFNTLTDLAGDAQIAVTDTFQTAWSYAILIIASALLAAIGLAVLLHHKEMVESYHVLSQCGIAPIRDKFILNIVNLVALLYDMVNPLVIVVARVFAFLQFGWISIVLGCSDTSLLWNALGEIGRALNAFFQAFSELVSSESPLDERFDLQPMFYHIGRAVRYIQEPLDCLAKFFDFIWAPVVLVPSFPSIHVTLDCIWNTPLRMVQAILRPIFGKTFALSPWADEVGCIALGTADVAQDLLLHVVQILTGVFSEIATPCDAFSGSPQACNVVGHCTYDSVERKCREIGRCDAYASRDACTDDSLCCFSANVNNVTHKVDFSCADAAFGQCPAAPGCSSLTAPAECARNSSCAWDPSGMGACVEHADICTNLVDQDCRTANSYCNAFAADDTCSNYTRGLCTVSGGQCVSYASLCFADPTIDPTTRNRTCSTYQLCGWNVTVNRTIECNTTNPNTTEANTTCTVVNETTTSVCLTRDVNDTIRATSASVNISAIAELRGIQMALNIPGADAPPDTMSKLLGVPILLAVLELQWAHSGIIAEPAVGIFRLLVQVIDNIFDAENAFGRYDGIAQWRIGYIFDHMRSWLYPIAQLGIILDLNLPCVLQSLLQVIPDLSQGLAELFLLLIYFSAFQPTGPANTVNAWLPLDYVASYYNDTRVSFMPLVFINRTVWQLERVTDSYYKRCHPNGEEFGKRSRTNCLDASDGYYDLEIDINTGIILYQSDFSSLPQVYNWSNISLTNTTVERVYIFPGLDRTIPRIIRDIQESSTCLERVLGDGTNFTKENAPWACFFRHLVNVMSELLNILLQIVMYVADIIRFTDNPIYRHTALDVTFEGLFAEWEQMAKCFGNMIRLGDPTGAGPYGVCTTDLSTLQPDGSYSRDKFSIVCCLGNLAETFLNGALIVTLNELMLFLREFIGVKFLPNSKVPHIPDLNAILARMEALIDDLGCALGGVIPSEWKCQMTLTEADDCRVLSERGNPVPCSYMQCEQGNECVARFISSVMRFILLTIPRAVSLVYSTIRRLAMGNVSQCREYDNDEKECAKKDCQYHRRTRECHLPGRVQAAEAAGALEQIVNLLSDLSTMLFTGFLAMMARLALVFDCIRCATVTDNDQSTQYAKCRQGKDMTDTTSGTPFYDFIVFLLAPILNIIKQLVKMVFSITIFGITLIIIIVTGQFEALDVMLDSFGDALEKVIAQLMSNIFGIALKALGLDKLYNTIINIINQIVIKGCLFINKVCTDLSLGCQLPCPSPLVGVPTGTDASYPPVNCSDYGFDPDGCNAWGTRCIYDPSTDDCRARVGCERGINRETCAPINDCMWRTTSNLTADPSRNLRARECVNITAVGMQSMPGAGNLATTPLTALDKRLAFNRAPCAGLSEAACNATAPTCRYDMTHEFCYHAAFARLCERLDNTSLRGVATVSVVRTNSSSTYADSKVCRGIYEMNQTANTTADETCVPMTITPGTTNAGIFAGDLCVRAFTDSCNFYESEASCSAFKGLCYWSESASACMSGRELCMTHTSAETCTEMTTLCGFATSASQCNASTLKDLCRYDTTENKCISQEAYCQRYEGTTNCAQYFSCKWDALGATEFTLTPTTPEATLYTMVKPRCVTVDMMERIVRIPDLQTNEILTGATPFYQRSKREVALDRDVLTRVVSRIAPMQWPAGDPCELVMDSSAYGGNVQDKVDALFGGAFEPFGEYMYCFGRQMWTRQASPPDAQLRAMIPVELLRDVGATATLSYPGQPTIVTKMTQGECDVLYNEYYNASTPMPWSELRPLERVTLVECTKNRMYGLYLRQLAGYMWLPEDIVDNPYRKYMFLMQAFHVMRVYSAYKEERAVTPETLLDPLYAERLSAQGLSTLDLVGLKTVEDVQAMLARVSVVDYFAYNGMGEREAQMAQDLSALFGGSLAAITTTLSNALGRLPYNTSRLSLGDMFANGTATTLGQVAVTSAAATASAMVDMTNTTFRLATDPQTYKRAIGATLAMGRMLYDASQTLLVWAGRLDPKTTMRGDGTTPVDPAPAAAAAVGPDAENILTAWSTKASEVKSTLMARVGARISAARSLLWRNKAAGVRRDKIAYFGEMVRLVVQSQLVIPLQHTTPESRADAFVQLRRTTRADVLSYKAPHMASFASRYDTTMGGLLDPVECLTGPGGAAGQEISTDWFCTNFIWLDGLLGRIVLLGKWLVRYYRGAPSDNLRVNFQDSFARFKAYANYVSNDSARIVVGDSDSNPVLWPYHNRSSLHLFGDRVQNKTRLYDYESLFVELVEAIKLGVSEPSSLRVFELIDNGVNSLFVRSSSSMWTASVNVAYYTGVVSNTTRASLIDRTAEWRDVKLAALRPVGEILKDLAERLFQQLITCSFPVYNEDGEIDGSKKRFAMAEMLAISILLILALFIPLMILFPNSLFTIASGLGVVLMIIVVLFLSMTYNWSYLCAPALPMELADDLRDMIGFTLAPKCNVLLSGSFYTPYTNENCYTCENARTQRSRQCVKELNITSLYDNLALITVMHFPDLPNTLRDLGLGSLVDQYTTFGERVAKFEASFNSTDPVSYANHWTCNWFYTLAPYLAMIQFGIVLLVVGSALLYFALNAVKRLWQILVRAALLAMLSIQYVLYVASAYPYLLTYNASPDDDAHQPDGTFDDDDDEDYDEDDYNDTDYYDVDTDTGSGTRTIYGSVQETLYNNALSGVLIQTLGTVMRRRNTVQTPTTQLQTVVSHDHGALLHNLRRGQTIDENTNPGNINAHY